jgi:hypothetical protein
MTPICDFLDGPKMIGGMKFRTFTVGSKALCSQLKLSMFISGNIALDEFESERQLTAFTWIHAAPLKDVLKAVRENTANEAIQEFGFSIPFGLLPQIVAEINRIGTQASENAVDVEQKLEGSTAKN